MSNNKVASAIKNILDIIFSEMNFLAGDSFYTFKYTGNIKTENDRDKLQTNPAITIFGQEKISQYEENYKIIYNELCKPYKLSYKTFKDITQNLIFEQQFNEESILTIIKEKVETCYVSIRKIYGLTCTKNKIKLGKYTFVSSSKIEEFITDNFPNLPDTQYPHFAKSIKNETNPKDCFVYFVVPITAIDANFALLQLDDEISKTIKLISFLCSKLPDRYYLGDKPPNSFLDNSIVLDKEGYGSISTSIKRKDLSIDVCESFFGDTEKGFNKLWDIFSKDNPTSFELRIIQSIIWFGDSLLETNWKVSLVQVSFAFETLLFNNQNEFISKSITASMAESFALIVGSSVEERIKLEKEFKDFYQNRSGIVHGGKINKEHLNSLNRYIQMFYLTIIKILTDSRFENCFLHDNLHEILQIEKYG